MTRLTFVDLLLRDPAALVIVKATIVLALAGAAAAAARALSAARRHMLWLVALASCVWLVLSSPLMPAITIHSPMFAQSGVMTAQRSAAVGSSMRMALADSPRARPRFANTNAVRPASLHSLPMPKHPLVVLWTIGCIALLIRYTIGYVGTRRLARRATCANDDESTRELTRVTAAAGMRRTVRLGYSTDVRTPITFGIVRQYVLLPTEARSWTVERRRAVLVHEAAHIARGDWLSQTIGQLACALFWFHPLAWHALARLRDDAERAADDCVLRSGMSAFDYAAQLLDLAHRAADTQPVSVAIGIVSTTALERRFVAMFDAKRCRAAVTSRARAVTTSVALAIVAPLASLQVGAPAHVMIRPLPPASFHLTPITHVSTPQPARVTRATSGAVDTAGTPWRQEMRAENVEKSATPTLPSAIVPVRELIPRRGAHPDFSGRWIQDTAAGSFVDFLLTDSTTIKQSANAISLQLRGHVLDQPISSSFQSLPFDGTEYRALIMSGIAPGSVTASAVWAGDTLVLTTYAFVYFGAGAHDVLTIERMTMSKDGNTLSSNTQSLADTKVRWNGPRTFVLRRMAP